MRNSGQKIGENHVLRLVAGVACLLLLGCTGGSTDPATGHQTCVRGESQACACPDDESGVQVCEDDGTFARCDCGADPQGHDDAGMRP